MLKSNSPTNSSSAAQQCARVLAYRALDCGRDHSDHCGYCHPQFSASQDFSQSGRCRRNRAGPSPPPLKCIPRPGATGFRRTCSFRWRRSGHLQLSVLIDTLIATAPNTKSGYTFGLHPEGIPVTSPPPGCTAGYTANFVTAVPLSVYSGTDSYCADEPGVIHYNTLGTAIASPGACDALPAIQ